jgi:two-component system sensor histidine kinase PhoQ
MLGNVMENACKYGNQRLMVSVQAGDARGDGPQAGLQIWIEDDGPGIAADLVDMALRRGVRFDSRETGQGIGLSMVSELLEIYDGDLQVETSTLGGAKVILTFQQARPAATSASLV